MSPRILRAWGARGAWTTVITGPWSVRRASVAGPRPALVGVAQVHDRAQTPLQSTAPSRPLVVYNSRRGPRAARPNRVVPVNDSDVGGSPRSRPLR